MKLLACLMLFVMMAPLSGAENKPLTLNTNTVRRDPFWPIGYSPKGSTGPAIKAEARPLTEAELADLVKREQERIRSMIAVNGMIKRGNRFYVFLNQDLLVTEGDVLEVDVDGVQYRLVIKSLSENNIQLEPYRQNKAK